METENAFIKRYKQFFLIANIFSAYVPGMKFLKVRGDVFFIYSIIIILLMLHNMCDLCYQLIFFSVPQEIYLLQIFGGFCVAFSCVQRAYILLFRKKVYKMFETLSKCMHPPLWPEVFEELIAKKYRSIVILTTVISIIEVGVNVTTAIEKLFFSRTVFYPTSYMGDVKWESYTNRAPLMVLVNQAICGIFLTSGWTFNNGIYTIILNTMQSHLEHLGTSLNKIMDVLYVNDNGVVLKRYNMKVPSPEEKKQLMDLTRKRLKIWITHHAEIIRSNNEVQEFLTPVITMQFGYLTIAIIGVLYVTIQGNLPLDIIVLVGCFIISCMSRTYLICRCGDAIAKKSGELAGQAITGNFGGLDNDIQKTLLKIGGACQRLFIGKPQRLYPINSETFMDIINLQYRFFTFIEHMAVHNAAN